MSALEDAVKHIQYSAETELDVKWAIAAACELAAKDARTARLEGLLKECEGAAFLDLIEHFGESQFQHNTKVDLHRRLVAAVKDAK